MSFDVIGYIYARKKAQLVIHPEWPRRHQMQVALKNKQKKTAEHNDTQHLLIIIIVIKGLSEVAKKKMKNMKAAKDNNRSKKKTVELRRYSLLLTAFALAFFVCARKAAKNISNKTNNSESQRPVPFARE